MNRTKIYGGTEIRPDLSWLVPGTEMHYHVMSYMNLEFETKGLDLEKYVVKKVKSDGTVILYNESQVLIPPYSDVEAGKILQKGFIKFNLNDPITSTRVDKPKLLMTTIFSLGQKIRIGGSDYVCTDDEAIIEVPAFHDFREAIEFTVNTKGSESIFQLWFDKQLGILLRSRSQTYLQNNLVGECLWELQQLIYRHASNTIIY